MVGGSTMKSEKKIDCEFHSVVLNQLDTGVFITEVETDRIVYINEEMKRRFNLVDPEGKPCYEVLQKNMKERCAFCNRYQLLMNQHLNKYEWNEVNTINHRLYKNIDQLVEWEGKQYFIENSMDITDLMHGGADGQAVVSELNKSGGAFLKAIRKARKEKKSLTIAMCDVNDMRLINEQYGWEAGNQVLNAFAKHTKQFLNEGDLFFPMGSDQFMAVLMGDNYQAAEKRMQQLQKSMSFEKDNGQLAYNFTFSVGLYEVYPSDQISVEEMIARADERLYQQQRAYHIMKLKKQDQKQELKSETIAFDYDKEHLYDALVASCDDYIFVGNIKTGVFRYSQAMVEEFGLGHQVVANATAFWIKLIYPEDVEGFLASNQEIADGRVDHHKIEYRAKNVRGEWIWLRCRGTLLRDKEGNPTLFAGFISNLGKQRQIDAMTGLENKFAFEEFVKVNLMNKNQLKHLGIMVLDIDLFKNINDLYNHSFGDEILRITASKLSSLLPSHARLYRLDGDEFAVVLLNTRMNDVLSFYQQIQTVFSHQQEYDGRKYYCTLSAGYAYYPQDADTYQDLLKYANYSLEHSKHIGKNRLTLFSKDILKQKERKLELLSMLRESIDRGFDGFSVNYQPQVNSKSQKLHGAEALARYTCDKYGDISPVEFIPLLEQSGLIVPFGNWVAYQAAKQCKMWCEYQPDFKVSINLSYRQLIEGDILPFMKETLNQLQLSPDNVVMELTETYLAQEDGSIRETISGLKRIGIQLAMDDFGTGYSSLFSLKNMPVNVVKIDRGFVKEITTDMFNATFIRTITELCHEVGKTVCLEGVESVEEYNVVKYSGIELIQGYYFGKPMTAQAFENQFFKKRV